MNFSYEIAVQQRREWRSVSPQLADKEFDALVQKGHHLMPQVLDASSCEELAGVVNELAATEMRDHSARSSNGTYYVRHLLDKHEIFDRFVDFAPTLELARALLGPQVRLWMDARIAYEDAADNSIGWHIHMRPPTPRPPWLSEPHSVNNLVFLSDVGEAEGALVVADGSHTNPLLTDADLNSYSSTTRYLPRTGDCIATHGNLWHRTESNTQGGSRRILLLVAYTAAWVTAEVAAPGQPRDGGVVRLKPFIPRSDTESELIGRFTW